MGARTVVRTGAMRTRLRSRRVSGVGHTATGVSQPSRACPPDRRPSSVSRERAPGLATLGSVHVTRRESQADDLTVAILAGGLGTRLGEQTRITPKPLIEVAGEPFLLHQLRQLARNGVERAVLCVGYLGETIERTIGTERFGIEISYSYDAPGLDGTLGAVRRALPLLGERFLVLYGDTYLRLDYMAAATSWVQSGLPALMTVLRNEGRWDASNVVYREGLVEAYEKGCSRPEMRWIDYGLGGLTSRALDHVGTDVRELASLYEALARDRLLYGFEVESRFYEIGTPWALAETDRFLRSGLEDAENGADL